MITSLTWHYFVQLVSLFLSGSSQQIISNNCDILFGRQQITEYICNSSGLFLQWIVEPVVEISDLIISTINGNPGDTLTLGNIVSVQDVRDPIVARLRITSDPSLPTADVVCLSNNINDTRPYLMDAFSKSHIKCIKPKSHLSSCWVYRQWGYSHFS